MVASTVVIAIGFGIVINGVASVVGAVGIHKAVVIDSTTNKFRSVHVNVLI